MTSPVPQSSALSTQLGRLVGDYPANSLQRYVTGIIVVVALWIALFGTIGNLEFDGGWRIIMLVFAVAAGVQLYFGIGAHAQLFEHGFVISRAGKTTSARWDEVANVEHKIIRSYLLGLIPLPSFGTRSYTITLTNRAQLTIQSWYFSNTIQMGNTIQEMWRQAAVVRSRTP